MAKTSKDQQDLAKALNRLVDAINKQQSTLGSLAKATEKVSAKETTAPKAEAPRISQQQQRVKEEQELVSLTEERVSLERDIAEAQKQIKTNEKEIGGEKFKQVDAARTLNTILQRQFDIEDDIKKAIEEQDTKKLESLQTERRRLKTQKDTVKLLQAQSAEQDNLNKKVSKATDDVNKKLEYLKNPLQSVGNLIQKKITDRVRESAVESSKAGKSVSGWGTAFKIAAGTAGVGLLVAGVKMLFGSMMKTNQEITDLQRNFGLTRDDARGVSEQIKEIGHDTDIVGMNAEEARNAYKELTGIVGGTKVANNDLIKSQVLLKKEYGMTSDEATKFQEQSMAVGMTAEQNLQLTRDMVGQYNKLTGDSLNHVEISKDLAKISNKTLASYKGDGKALVYATIQARKLGMTMEDTQGVADNLLDIENSIAAETKASAILGRSINMDKARELALQGKTAEAAAAAVDAAGDYDEFLKMNVFEQKAVAEAAGMSVDQLVQAGKMKKINSKLTGKEVTSMEDLTDAQIEQLKNQKVLSEEEAKNLVKQKQAASAQENWNKLVNKLSGYVEKIAGKLEPVLDGLVSMADKFLDTLSSAKDGFKALIPDWMKSFLKSDVGGKVAGTTAAIAAGVGLFKMTKGFFAKKPDQQTADNTKITADNTKKLVEMGGAGSGAGGGGGTTAGDDSGGAGDDIKTKVGKGLLNTKLGKKFMKSKAGKMLGFLGKSPLGAMIGDATGVDVQGMMGDSGAAPKASGGTDVNAYKQARAQGMSPKDAKNAAQKMATPSKPPSAPSVPKPKSGGGFFSKVGSWLSDKASKLNPLKALKGFFKGPGLKKLLGKIPKIGSIVSTAMSLGSAAMGGGGAQEIGKQIVMALGDLGGSILGSFIPIPGVGTILGGMGGSALAGLIADNVDVSGIGKMAIDLFGGGAPAAENTTTPTAPAAPGGTPSPKAVKDTLIRPGQAPVTFDKNDLIVAGTNIDGSAATGGNPTGGSNAEMVGLLKQLVAHVSKPVQISLGNKVLEQIEKVTTMTRSYNTKMDKTYGGMG